MLQAVFRLFLLALIVHSIGRLLRRVRAPGRGGISQEGDVNRGKNPRYDGLTPYEIADGEFEEIPQDRA
ncbi:MAG: hypothetical protein OEO21_06465 [Candidatus Krumholzibacteria bacterium]|nr:hypothetical protein [Candidatus Krumholzibacteria bacterium]